MSNSEAVILLTATTDFCVSAAQLICKVVLTTVGAADNERKNHNRFCMEWFFSQLLWSPRARDSFGQFHLLLESRINCNYDEFEDSAPSSLIKWWCCEVERILFSVLNSAGEEALKAGGYLKSEVKIIFRTKYKCI